VVFGGGRDFAVDVKASGTLTAKVDWSQDGVPLGMYVVNQANSGQVLMDAAATGNEAAHVVPAGLGGFVPHRGHEQQRHRASRGHHLHPDRHPSRTPATRSGTSFLVESFAMRQLPRPPCEIPRP
jgi:hypothetical protein